MRANRNGGFGGPKPVNLGGSAKMLKPSPQPMFVGAKMDKMPTIKSNSHMTSASHDQFVKNIPGWTKGGF